MDNWAAADLEERRFALLRKTVRRTLFTNTGLARRCREARQRLARLKRERAIIAKRLYVHERNSPRKFNIVQPAQDIEIEHIGNVGEDLSGFVSWRRYMHLLRPLTPAWYRCCVFHGPTFAIEFGECTFSGSTPQEVHAALISRVNERLGPGCSINHCEQGPSFFGFTHPDVVQKLPPHLAAFLKLDACLPSHESVSFDEFVRVIGEKEYALKSMGSTK